MARCQSGIICTSRHAYRHRVTSTLVSPGSHVWVPVCRSSMRSIVIKCMLLLLWRYANPIPQWDLEPDLEPNLCLADPGKSVFFKSISIPHTLHQYWSANFIPEYLLYTIPGYATYILLHDMYSWVYGWAALVLALALSVTTHRGLVAWLHTRLACR